MSIFENFGRKTIFVPAQNNSEAEQKIVSILREWTLEEKNLLLEIASKPDIKNKLKYAKNFV